MPIRVLPDIVAAQIAAGEVIERPASVVKELIENALDAGADAIAIDIEEGGRRLIRVSDNGSGIPADEVELAFARHATSKLQAVDDLNRIQTLGFRGEALASIAAVSHVVLTTRHQDELAGTMIHAEGGELRSVRATGAPSGTVAEVSNLFFNTPARLKFLKSDSTERRHITQLVTRYAMAYPSVRFRLVQEGREQFHSTGSGDLADVLVEAFGLDAFTDMLEVSPLPPTRADLPDVAVYGFASSPALNRANRSHIVLFVNGRTIADQSLTYAVVQAYHTLIPNGRYPLAVLLITLDPQEVDVNVHPTKAEVRFRSPDTVFSAVQKAVRSAVVGQAPVPSMQSDPYRNVDEGWRAPGTGAGGAGRRPLVPGERQLLMDLDAFSPGRRAQQRPDVAALPRASEAEIPSDPGGPARPRTLPVLRVIGQIGATYIVAEGPAGLYLIDQHAAHERILYEQFMTQQTAMEPIAQQTLAASTVEFPPATAQLVVESLDLLARWGFLLEEFGGTTFRVRTVPALLADQEPGDVVRAVVQDLESEQEPGAATLEEKLVRRVCKAAAVKAGQTLSFDEMEGMIRQLERCESPRTCPHGRPTMLHISGEDLARQFGRE